MKDGAVRGGSVTKILPLAKNRTASRGTYPEKQAGFMEYTWSVVRRPRKLLRRYQEDSGDERPDPPSDLEEWSCLHRRRPACSLGSAHGRIANTRAVQCSTSRAPRPHPSIRSALVL